MSFLSKHLIDLYRGRIFISQGQHDSAEKIIYKIKSILFQYYNIVETISESDSIEQPQSLILIYDRVKKAYNHRNVTRTLELIEVGIKQALFQKNSSYLEKFKQYLIKIEQKPTKHKPTTQGNKILCSL